MTKFAVRRRFSESIHLSEHDRHRLNTKLITSKLTGGKGKREDILTLNKEI